LWFLFSTRYDRHNTLVVMANCYTKFIPIFKSSCPDQCRFWTTTCLWGLQECYFSATCSLNGRFFNPINIADQCQWFCSGSCLVPHYWGLEVTHCLFIQACDSSSE
jgi:hypothetical protein